MCDRDCSYIQCEPVEPITIGKVLYVSSLQYELRVRAELLGLSEISRKIMQLNYIPANKSIDMHWYDQTQLLKQYEQQLNNIAS